MTKRVSYPVAIKREAVKMKLEGVPTKVIMEQLGIKNKTQVETWVRWYKNGETYRFQQPVGKQYTYGKGPVDQDDLTKLKIENHFLKQQVEILKKYNEIERKWLDKRH